MMGRTLLFLAVLLVQAGCIRQYDDFTGAQDVASDSHTSDGRQGEIREGDATLDSVLPDSFPLKDTVDTVDTQDACVPDCEEKECGDDGCGGSCGTCGDTDPCNGNDLCEEGKCVQDSPPDCNDGNPCTEDSCVEEQGCENSAVPDIAEPACDDGNPCTTEMCVAGACVNLLKNLEELVIEDCVCQAYEDCLPLEDGAICNGTLTCLENPDSPEINICQIDEATIAGCDDEVPCTEDSCEPDEEAADEAGCIYVDLEDGTVPLGEEAENLCDDGDACTDPDACANGVCVPGETVDCDDQNLCTDDSCEPANGCVFFPNEVLCDDDDDCTWQDQCGEGLCAGTPYICEAPAQCETVDGATCNGDGTCAYGTAPMDGLPCDDGDVCNEGEACEGGTCMGGAGISCDDANPCTDDSCDPVGGCVHVNNDVFCDDNNTCTEGDTCVGGVCTGTGDLDCDDANPCTDDSCSPSSGCVSTDDDENICDDGHECTVNACQNGSCMTTEILVCGGTCGVCTGAQEECVDGACVCQPACDGLDCGDDGCGDVCGTCDDGNTCTDEICTEGGVCDFTSNADPCDDGDSCTEWDYCEDGACAAGPTFTCDPDHDGVCPEVGCPTIMADPCPTVWTPDGVGDVCDTLPGTFLASRAIPLTEPGAATGTAMARRTYEVVEIPLKNGMLEHSVVALWRLDSDCTDSSGKNNPCTEINKPILSDGPFGGGVGALYFNNVLSGSSGKPYLKTDLEINWGPDVSFSIMLWAQSGGPGDILGGGGGVFGTNQPGDELHFLVAHPTIDFGVHVRDADNDSIDVEFDDDSLPDGAWHHYAAVYDSQNHSLSIFMDGDIVGLETNSAFSGVDLSARPPYIGAHNNGDDFGSSHFHGTIGDVTIFKRAITPGELESYYLSNASYATDFVPGVQADLDDIRVTEFSDQIGESYQVPFEILGPRPHSDASCPVDDTVPSAVPHIADREDMCGVVGYWPLDGDGAEVTGDYPGFAYGTAPATGRFGDQAGSVETTQGDRVVVTNLGDAAGIQDSSLTMEAWVLWSGGLAPGMDEVYFLGKLQTTSQSAFSLYVDDAGDLTCKVATSAGSQYVTADMVSRRWAHFACTYDGAVVRLYVDGIQRNEGINTGTLQTSSQPFRMVSWVGGEDSLLGQLDEVLIHDTAKSPEYIYRRANPGVPTVRFLASTEVEDADSDGFDWYDYTLHWGDEAAGGQQAVLAGLGGEECYGLLSPCFGYAGWWRLDEGQGMVASDASTWKLAGVLRDLGGGLPNWTAGRRGAGLWYEDDSGDVEIPDAAHLHLDAGVMEVSFTPGEDLTGWDPTAGIMPLVSKIICQTFSDGFSFAISAPTRVVLGINASIDDTPQYASSLGMIWDMGTWYGVNALFGPGGMEVLTDGASGFDVSDHEGGISDPASSLHIGSFIYDEDPLTYITHWGALDEVRFMSRRLAVDELLQYPAAVWGLGAQVGCVPD